MLARPDAVYLARSPIDRADAPFATYRELAYRTLAALEVPLPDGRHHLAQTQRHRALSAGKARHHSPRICRWPARRPARPRRTC